MDNEVKEMVARLERQIAKALGYVNRWIMKLKRWWLGKRDGSLRHW
jgi:hypothetical protein